NAEQHARQEAEAAENARRKESLAKAAAEKSEQQALSAKGEAEASERESRRRLIRLTTSNGVRAMDEGDLFGALPWFAEALNLDEGDAAREASHGRRIAAVLNESPRLLQQWTHEGGGRDCDFSPDGRLVVTAGNDRQVVVWDMATGAIVGKPMLHGSYVDG